MKIKQIISAVVVSTLLLATPLTTFAKSSDKVSYMTQEEMESEVWDNLSKFYKNNDDGSFKYSLSVSITYGEYNQFIKEYKPLNSDVTVADVSNDFNQYYGKLYENIEFDQDENGKYYEYDISKPDEHNYWVYNEDTDKFICTNSDNKVIKTYDRYYLPDEEQGNKITDENTNNKTDDTSNNETPAQTAKEAQIASQAVVTQEDIAQPTAQAQEVEVTASTSEQEPDVAVAVEPNSNKTLIATISIIVLVIVAVAVYLIIRKNKNKVNKK